jgi:FKBP-type peptidyl-prolyl cis-trans isomerase (trigger factor)
MCSLQLRIDLPGKVTQKVFDQALASLARDAPPVPGFRRSKGGIINNQFLARIYYPLASSY